MNRSLSVVVLLALFSSGCAGFLTGGSEEQAAASKYAEAKTLLKDHKYPESLTAFQKVIEEYPNSDLAANALYGVATVLVSGDNPHRDYAQALIHFDEFLHKYPQHERAADAQNWHQAIKVIIDAKKENERLLKNIEKLKQLDMRQEKKRLGR